jgi:hypothetical protein
MNTTTKVLVFGVVSGLIWSLVLIAFGDGFTSVRDTADILVPGILTGVLVSFALKKPLSTLGRFGAFIAGLLSLPLGAFLFGFLGSIMEIISVGTVDLNPILSGLFCAMVSVISIFAFYFFPPAIFTTFILRAVILSGRGHRPAASFGPAGKCADGAQEISPGLLERSESYPG